MSIALKIEHVLKKYGETVVIPDLSLNIKEGEFFTLLGPSGCGKTTLLRMVAGFNSIEGGSIYFEDQVINNVPPGDRNIGMVFQNYAIFPHLTVAENVAFGLKNRKIPKAEITKRVDHMLQLVQMEKFKDRMPENLSGGQQQRVALARAVVIQPDVLLMDEPLSNLDAKLRVEMREIIKEIQSEVGITTIYVTHDQEEAMAISDRIAIMQEGEIKQIGTPQQVYQRPNNSFVATFIGRTNLIDASVVHKDGQYQVIVNDEYNIPRQLIENVREEQFKVKLSVRPDEFLITNNEQGLKATVVKGTFFGQNTQYIMQLESGQKVEVIQTSVIGDLLEPGHVVYLQVDEQKLNIFDEQGEKNLTEGAHEYALK